MVFTQSAKGPGFKPQLFICYSPIRRRKIVWQTNIHVTRFNLSRLVVNILQWICRTSLPIEALSSSQLSLRKCKVQHTEAIQHCCSLQLAALLTFDIIIGIVWGGKWRKMLFGLFEPLCCRWELIEFRTRWYMGQKLKPIVESISA